MLKRAWLAAILVAIGLACSDSPTGPERFAECPGTTDPFLGCPSDGDLFKTPEERARAQAETERLGAILDRHVDALFGIPGVIGTGVGYCGTVFVGLLIFFLDIPVADRFRLSALLFLLFAIPIFLRRPSAAPIDLPAVGTEPKELVR